MPLKTQLSQFCHKLHRYSISDKKHRTFQLDHKPEDFSQTFQREEAINFFFFFSHLSDYFGLDLSLKLMKIYTNVRPRAEHQTLYTALNLAGIYSQMHRISRSLRDCHIPSDRIHQSTIQLGRI